MSLNRILAIFYKECIQIRRDIRSLGIAFIMPLTLLILFGYAINLDVKNIAMAVCDQDRTPSSRRLIDRFTSSGYFLIKHSQASPAMITRLLDKGVIKLLERPRLPRDVAKVCYDVLAELSTRPAVSELLDRTADGDKNAAAALSRCTPAAAEQMLEKLGGDDPELRVEVYNAVTKICNVRSVKRPSFWRGKDERVKEKEIERVKELVSQEARRWKEKYAEYR